jgi:uncharacterized protein
VWLDRERKPEYRARWALDHVREREAFESLIDEVVARWAEHPNLHVYHFGVYDKRSMGRYGTREEELDRLPRRSAPRMEVDLGAGSARVAVP